MASTAATPRPIHFRSRHPHILDCDLHGNGILKTLPNMSLISDDVPIGRCACSDETAVQHSFLMSCLHHLRYLKPKKHQLNHSSNFNPSVSYQFPNFICNIQKGFEIPRNCISRALPAGFRARAAARGTGGRGASGARRSRRPS